MDLIWFLIVLFVIGAAGWFIITKFNLGQTALTVFGIVLLLILIVFLLGGFRGVVVLPGR